MKEILVIRIQLHPKKLSNRAITRFFDIYDPKYHNEQVYVLLYSKVTGCYRINRSVTKSTVQKIKRLEIHALKMEDLSFSKVNFFTRAIFYKNMS